MSASPERTALYRLYDSGGELLYVGITNNTATRWADHERTKRWWPDVAEKTVEWIDSRNDAATAEVTAIRDEHPRYNVAQRPAGRLNRKRHGGEDPYRLAVASLRTAIQAGEYGPGDRLPTVTAIARQHDIAPVTAQKVVRALVAEGLAVTRKRAGTFVREIHTGDPTALSLDDGAVPSAELTAPGIATPPARIADLLGVPRTDSVIVFGNQTAEKLCTRYIPFAVGGKAPGFDVAKHFGPDLPVRTTVEARFPDEDEQTALQVSPALPLLVVTKLWGEAPVLQVEETRISAERFSLTYAVRRAPSAAWPRVSPEGR